MREVIKQEIGSDKKDLARKNRAEWVRLKILEDPQLAT